MIREEVVENVLSY